MMSEEKKLDINQIDEFYGESESVIKPSEENLNFTDKLVQVSEKLAVLDENIFEIDIDIMGIIERAEGIKEKKRERKELVLFMGAALTVLGCYSLLAFTVGYKFLIISQLVLITLMPWTIVPIALKRRKGSEM